MKKIYFFFCIAFLLAFAIAGPIYQHHNPLLVFVGDSITAQCNWQELLPSSSVLNKGVGSDTTHLVNMRLDDIIASKPDKLFLMIGINDLRGGRTVTSVASTYNDILERLVKSLPKTQIVVQSVLPMNNLLDYNAQVPNNDKIIALNGEIQLLASKYGLSYLDLFSLMADSNGRLRQDLTPDGIHLNRNGYFIWREAIAPFL